MTEHERVTAVDYLWRLPMQTRLSLLVMSIIVCNPKLLDTASAMVAMTERLARLDANAQQKAAIANLMRAGADRVHERARIVH